MNQKQFTTLSLLFEEGYSSIVRELHDCIEMDKLIRVEIYFKDIDRISSWCNKLNLNFCVGSKNFILSTDKGMATWSSLLIPCDSNINAVRLVYFHSNMQVCIEGKKLDESNDDLNFGLLLGYPKCCIDSYLYWKQFKSNLNDPISFIIESYPYRRELQDFHFPNPFTRYVGKGLYSHYPCSLNCQRTKDIALVSVRAMQKNFPKATSRYLKFENTLVLFQLDKGVCLWENFYQTDNKIIIDNSSFSGQGLLKESFKRIDEIELRNHELLLISSKTKLSLSPEGLFFGAFNTNYS